MDLPGEHPPLERPAQARRGGRPGRAAAEVLRQAILDAAEAIFLREGFGSARMEAIAAAAGTTKQTLYTRFGSKAALFVEVSNRLLEGRFVTTRTSEASLRDTLVAASEETLAAMLDPKLVRMYCIITAEALRFPELARLSDEDRTFPGRLKMLALLESAVQSGELVLADTRSAMLMLQDLVLAGPLKAAALGLEVLGPEARRARAEQAVDLFLNGARPRS